MTCVTLFLLLKLLWIPCDDIFKFAYKMFTKKVKLRNDIEKSSITRLYLII